MRHALTPLLLLAWSWACGQDQVHDRIQALRLAGGAPARFALALPADREAPRATLPQGAQAIAVSAPETERLLRERPALIEFDLPWRERPMRLILTHAGAAGPAPRLVSSAGDTLAIGDGATYHGVIDGVPGSLAAFRFTPRGVAGMASAPALSTVMVAPLPAGGHAIYPESAAPIGAGRAGGTRGDPPPRASGRRSPPGPPAERCVRIYYEHSHNLFADNNSDLQQTADWIAAVHAILEALYADEGITIAFSEAFVWTTPMPFP
ncbi:MAG: hypothetical protein ACK4L7_05945, partial [Flavobacteriales bacterium]